MLPPWRTQMRRTAQAQALLTRRQLNAAMNQPIDVYKAVRAMRLWLMFQPMDGLLGMYQRHDGSAGMVLNVKVHPALQRYTAAHELGHHVLGHEVGIDPEHHIIGWSNLREQETEAQLFASEFLMPLAAINAAARELGIREGSIDAADVYQLSLRLRTSYSAMITRLQMLEWITSAGARKLRAIAPKSLKRELLGHALPDPRGDVWVVTDHAKGPIQPHVGDNVVFDLLETPSTGYRWDPELPPGLSVHSDTFRLAEPGGEIPIGSPGHRRLEVNVEEPATGQSRFTLRRPWDPEAVGGELRVGVASTPRPTQGVDPRQMQLPLPA